MPLVTCFRLGLSKALGIGVILGSVLVKVPQVYSIIKSKSGAGLSIPSLALELFCYTSMAAYGHMNKFPFSAYGEAFFLALQVFIITFLVFKYQKSSSSAFIFGAIFILFASVLIMNALPHEVISTLQGFNTPISVISKLLQAYSNFSNKSTGQLSLVSMLLIFLGSLARIFTSLVETGDVLMITNFIFSSSCNALILGQILYYGDRPKIKVE
ncbi:hypothetical protein Ciccas_007858 [Cichlidogyrus casuarinus]|uniref:Mannose-P-dolichol utilization defect 1 protein homolog n=1 Tax=Cichlidogyrus casuarinus TaxID=1844966 RepID=A0ABD2Q4A5_9PLAT